MLAAVNINEQLEQQSIPRLHPRIHPSIRSFLDQPELLHNLCDGFGSPLNIMFPENIDENIQSFEATYKKNHMRGRIYFTSKPCKSRALVRRASIFCIGIDVSSPESLKHVMSCGFSPDRIEATGPKNAEYILNCLQLDVLLNADSMSELQLILELRGKLGLSRKARVMVRLGGFESSRMRFTPQDGTFGIHTRDIPAVIDWLVQHKDKLDFHGFAFYLSGAGVEQRTVAIENQLQMTFLALQKGLKPRGLDIGGGFSVQYAESEEAWNDYLEVMKKSVAGEIPSQTWNNSGLGYRNVNGVVAGAPLIVNHVPSHIKGDELDLWLNQRSVSFGNVLLADLIRDSLLELYIEPGRGMLDQCGITVGRVAFTKESTWGEMLVGLEMNRSNNHSQNLKQLCDPVIIPRHPGRNQVNTRGVYYVGNLCVSYDILQYNKTYPDIMPELGDLVVFINTAAYMMDFVESETLMQPVAQKAAVWPDKQSGFRWAQDDKYLPIEA
ncbi:MAG: pyridoxal-dependent decarboxylase [Micavibrio sp.]